MCTISHNIFELFSIGTLVGASNGDVQSGIIEI